MKGWVGGWMDAKPVLRFAYSSYNRRICLHFAFNESMLILYLSGFNMMEGILIQNNRLISSLQNLEKSQAKSIGGGDFPHGS